MSRCGGVVFDAGQNSGDNFTYLAATGLHYISSVPASDCPELTALPATTRSIVDEGRTDHDNWPLAEVTAGYRSQSEAEFSFRQLKDPHVVSFSPMFHIPAGQFYVGVDRGFGDYYVRDRHDLVVGNRRLVEISFNHRRAFVDANDVLILR